MHYKKVHNPNAIAVQNVINVLANSSGSINTFDLETMINHKRIAVSNYPSRYTYTDN